jgi:glycosyltransferase involved in cell wall biosynthesis
MRCLWIARELPFPMEAGDRIYSASLARALAGTGAQVHVLGHRPLDAPPGSDGRPGDCAAATDGVQWRAIAGGRRSIAAALASPLPLFAALHATSAYRGALRDALAQPWDAVVLDQLGSGWACAPVRAARPAGARKPVIVYLSHNHETAIWAAMAREAAGAWPRRAAVRLNAAKVARLERQLARGVDLIGAITAEDAAAYRMLGPDTPSVVLTPGYGGPVAPPRTLDAATPRRVLLVGSYGWVVKQENLRRFLAEADPVFAANGIALDVVGRMPDSLRDALRPGLRATTLHGFVDDVSPLLRAARLAVVPEVIGGGFKLKFLDYLFGRLPVATIADAAAGLEPALRERMICAPDMAALVAAIVGSIDRVCTLEAMQSQAFAIAARAFRWADRGAALRGAIEARAAG